MIARFPVERQRKEIGLFGLAAAWLVTKHRFKGRALLVSLIDLPFALPTAVAGCGAGRALLEDVLRWEHVLDEAPEVLAAYGREVLVDTKARMEELAAGLGYADAAAAVSAAQADTPAPADLVAAYRSAVEAARAFVVEQGIVALPADEELAVEASG